MGGFIGGSMFIYYNEQIDEKNAKSQQIVRHAYFHAYNTPFLIKVVYNGFIYLNIWNYNSAYSINSYTWHDWKYVAILWCWMHISTSIAIRETSRQVIIVYSSMDSDLEAFSHNPTDGSFAALAFQLTAFTNYLNKRFLSYWVWLLFRQRTHQ